MVQEEEKANKTVTHAVSPGLCIHGKARLKQATFRKIKSNGHVTLFVEHTQSKTMHS